MSLTIIASITAFVIWYLSAFPRNYRNARKSGLPFYFSPVNPNSPAWLICVAILGYSRVAKVLPRVLFDRVKLTIPGWEHHSHYVVNERLGKTFLLVSPGDNVAFVADPEIANAVLTRRKDFGRIEVAAQIMEVFGPNLTSSDHGQWQRHRRIVAPTLNERVMDAVWNEALAQTRDMMIGFQQSSLSNKVIETNSIFGGLKTITINVIASIGFGTSYSQLDVTSVEIEEGLRTTLMTSIVTISRNILVTVFIPAKLLTFAFMPKSVQQIGFAKREFPLHLQRIMSRERSSPTTSNSLLSTLVRLADQEQSKISQSSKTSTHLTEEEITGNLFNFIAAGFDTTANTLTYSILELAMHPDWQEWIFEGIDEAANSSQKIEYDVIFPRLTRCLALMFETLRLHTPLSHVARKTTEDQRVGNILFAPGTLIQVSAAVIHTSPAIWGPDADTFRPSRWLEGGRSPMELLRYPPSGTFLPWSLGPRFCPGIKMSQVEFVAVIFHIFAKWRVEVVAKDTETLGAVRNRLGQIVADSSPRLTMQVNRPQDIELRWIQRRD